MLFEYNLPALDDVIRVSRPPIPMPASQPKTTAQKVAGQAPRTTGHVPRTTGQTPRTAPAPASRNADPMPRRSAAEVKRKREEEQRRQKNSRMATIAIISCSLVAVVALVIFLVTLFNGSLFTKPQKLIEVPMLVGEVYEQLDEYPSLELIKEEVYDDAFPAGIVIAQKPDAGDRVVEGTKLIATVSLGAVPKQVTMDDLVGMDETSARNLLDSYDLGLNIVIETENSEVIEVGKVTRTIPELGKELRKDDNIILYVSLGPEINISAMPNVLEKTKEMASSILDSQKLRLKISTMEIYDSNVEKGCVVKTEPVSGDQLQTGQEVLLYISKGPEMKAVPNVVGMNIDTATSVLKNAGFKTPDITLVESEEEKNTVIKQDPGKNTDWDITQVIKLEVSKGPAPTTEPTTEPTTAPTTAPTLPTPVTKDVVIDLKGEADAADTHVSITCNGTEIYSQTVPAGTKTITLPGQSGVGTVVYSIVVNLSEGWETSVVFTN